MKKKLDKLDFIKIKTFCAAKDIIKKMKRQLTYGLKYCQVIFDKGLTSNIKNSYNSKKQLILKV